MSVKIKISYTTKEELEKILQVLSPVMKDYKIAKNQEGQYKKDNINQFLNNNYKFSLENL